MSPSLDLLRLHKLKCPATQLLVFDSMLRYKSSGRDNHILYPQSCYPCRSPRSPFASHNSRLQLPAKANGRSPQWLHLLGNEALGPASTLLCPSLHHRLRSLLLGQGQVSGAGGAGVLGMAGGCAIVVTTGVGLVIDRCDFTCQILPAVCQRPSSSSTTTSKIRLTPGTHTTTPRRATTPSTRLRRPPVVTKQ